MVSGTSIVLSKFTITSADTFAEVLFLLTISSSYTWVFCIGQKHVNISQCQVLNHISDKLRSTGDVLRVITVLDSSSLCVGNPDTKFSQLIEHYKHGFKDASGNFDFAEFAIM